MKVLVVHDREEVGEEIVSIVQDTCAQAIVELVDDATKARGKLSASYYDIMILDLTIAVVSTNGNASFQVAEGLLEELFVSERLFTPGGILGITQDASALDRIENNIGPHLMVILSEELDGVWKSQLRDRIQYVQLSAVALASSLLSKHDYDVLFVSALDKEIAPFSSMFEMKPHATIEGVETFLFNDRVGQVRRGAAYAIGRAGQASAASEVQGLLCQIRPKIAIMTGFCGGVPGKAELGTILFAESAVDWDYGKWKPTDAISRLYARPEPISVRNSKLHRIARQLVEGGTNSHESLVAGMLRDSKGEITAANIILAPFASGSAIIGDKAILENVKHLNDSIGGVDMECFGFYFACKYAHAAKPEFICLKAVADACGPDKDDRLHKACCFATALVAKDIITALCSFE